MTGRIIDLARTPFSPLGPTALDADVVIDRLLASFGFAHRRNAIRAEAFFQSLHAANERAILTPTAYNEVIHAAVKSVYREARPAHREVLTSRTRQRGGFSWLDLYKLEPSILKEHVTMLRDMGERLLAEDVVILDPSDLVVPHGGSHYRLALPELVARYGLDSSDATILIEASRVGIYSIVSFDRDMRRAAADFDVYTWLDDD